MNDATSSQQCEFVCACHPSPISDVFSQQPFSIKLLFHPGQLTHPQSTRQIRARCCYRMLASRVDRRVMVSFPVLFIFPPPFKTFSHSLSRRPCRPPSLIQSREQRPATTIPTSEVCGEGGDIEFPFVFFHYFKCFLTAFFQLNCYLVGGWVCCFSFSFLPLISILLCPMFQLKMSAKTSILCC